MYRIFNQPEVGNGGGAATSEAPAAEAQAAPAAPKASRKSVKKAAKKAPAKKAAKKAAKSGANGSPGRAKKEGLRNPQVRILAALRKHGQLSRADIAKKAPVDNAACTEYMGSADPDVRAANDKKHFPSLLGLKFIRQVAGQDKEGNETVEFEITASGKAALEKAEKE